MWQEKSTFWMVLHVLWISELFTGVVEANPKLTNVLQ